MTDKHFDDKLMDLVRGEKNLQLVVSSMVAMLGILAANSDVELKDAEGNVAGWFRHHFILARQLRELKEKHLH